MNRFLITMLGGLIALVPLILIGYLLIHFFGFIKWLSQPLIRVVPVDSVGGLMAANLVALFLLLLLVFLVGRLSRSMVGRKIDRPLESHLARIIPGYTFVRGLSAQLNGDEEKLPVVLVRQDDGASIGFEMERNENGWVSVFLPSSPQPWSGSVMVINADRVITLELSYPKAIYMFQQMGRGVTAYLPDVNDEIQRDGLLQGHPVKPSIGLAGKEEK